MSTLWQVKGGAFFRHGVLAQMVWATRIFGNLQ